MKIFERSNIERLASAVWPFIVIPENFQLWNDKVQSMDASGRFSLGQVFITHYKMGQKEIQCTSTVTAIEEEKLLEIRHSNCESTKNTGPSKDLVVVERISLEEKGQRTIVIKEVNITNHHTNILLIALIWIITRLGKRVGPDKLKKLCEAGPLP